MVLHIISVRYCRFQDVWIASSQRCRSATQISSKLFPHRTGRSHPLLHTLITPCEYTRLTFAAYRGFDSQRSSNPGATLISVVRDSQVVTGYSFWARITTVYRCHRPVNMFCTVIWLVWGGQTVPQYHTDRDASFTVSGCTDSRTGA